MSKFILKDESRALITKALALMEKFPEHYDQEEPVAPKTRGAACNSTGCIAGFIWAAATSRQRKKHEVKLGGWCDVNPENTALLLGVDEGETCNFYYSDQWPMKFRRAFYADKNRDDPKSRARIAKERMLHWINTGK